MLNKPTGDQYPLKKWPNTVKTLTTAVLATAVLSGCLLNRAMEAKQQFCAYDANFSLNVADTAVFEFHNPVFLPADVELMVGHLPARTSASAEELRWSYEIEKVSSNEEPGERYSGALVFLQSEGEFKLGRVEFPAFIGLMVENETMQSTADDICSASLPLFSRTIEEDISDEQISQLPGRALLFDWLGQPSRLVDDDKGLQYEYQLVSDGEPVTVAEFTIWYENGNETPSRAESKSRRAFTTFDIATRKITMSYRS